MRIALTAAVGLAITASPAAAALRLYSYDPADAETRSAAGPLTFEFKAGLFRTTMISLRATEAQATAYLKPVGEKDLGPVGLTALIGAAPERDLYEVRSDHDGPALIAAFCPGATRAWAAFGTPRPNRSLRVFVLGPPAAGGAAHVCRTLNFTFHGAWQVPPTEKIPPRLAPESPFRRY